MLVIRFFRVGKKNQPSFKIVVTDKRRPPRAGRFVEEVGFYNPLTKEKVLRAERIKYWLSKGAKPSDTVYNLLVKEKILEGKKIPKHKVSKKEKPVPEEKVEKVITEEKTVKEAPKEKKEETPSAEKSIEETPKEEEKKETEAKEEIPFEKPAEELSKEEKTE